ncbi:MULTISPECIES: bifunctional DNA-formamidopyrimidine glycosylase/DNA-(apurinic or apyrimidinic site) lyase [Halomonadaceae]|uniref:Formamidopyrimidine-DNA glycosylase n=1 Tax=Vreelandella titanicae TaxID=664683 RepID=A0A558JC54_9GAMM|nr:MULTISPECIES: bifunctional DNA-formamidopyrimidine glycosylase/DNA-(apurinic or apyrimidinic site) lyase [Halomonas]MBR9906126.1 bifunctional DNA-formamidopyrimidine glycosylase/DNA-(apurinic or apyrimidinic site) lyase [Gammaproteobacteria bacterium]TVU91210.1 bifunctional DNA-formamidopyrimidine glycosylase/DNA-(apurinic or apyrimidinic site) lyase [Halomonas titanicae]CEP37761.1 Formamidopyrimidine-DNA glycosylase [Halomonas sp. R57-5]
MPELPEVETTRRGIAPYIEGQEVTEVLVRQPRLRVPVPDDLAERLVGARIGVLKRRAKYLQIPIQPADALEGDANATLLWHLGMSGSLRIARVGDLPKKHDHVDVVTASGYVLRYHDPRRFGFVDWQAEDETQDKRLAHLGPEPLSDAFNGKWLYTLSRHKRVAVKPFLMDNQVVVGAGNIYAAEALFMAGIDPRRAAGRVSRARYDALALAVKEVLAAAITQGGTTLRDFVSGQGEPGYFAQRLNVYGRHGQPCLRCGVELRRITLGQRASVFCPGCQR